MSGLDLVTVPFLQGERIAQMLQPSKVDVFRQWPCNRNRLIGGTNPIYCRPIFEAYVLGLFFRGI